MRKRVVITQSKRPQKRLEARFPSSGNRGYSVHFGQKGGSAFPDHKDEKTKENWEKGHRVRGNWDDFDTAGALSKHVLWNKKSIQASIDDLNKRQREYEFVYK